MSQNKTIPILFSHGMNTQLEESTLPEGYAQEIQNWEVTGAGGLRARPYWGGAYASVGGDNTLRSAGQGFGFWSAPGDPIEIFIAQLDTSPTFNILYADYADVLSDWVAIEDAGYTDGMVAFASGAGVIAWTHEAMTDGIHIWDGATVALPTLPDLSTSADVAGRAMSFYTNRFFTGGSTATPSRLYFSNLGDALVWDTAVDYIDIGEDDNEAIEDLHPFLDGLMIAKTNSLWLLTGAGEDSFRVRRLDGGTSARGRTLVPTPKGMVIIGYDRVWLYNGHVDDLAQPINGTLTGGDGFDSITNSGAYVDGKLYLCTGTNGITWVLDMDQGAWWREISDEDEGVCVIGEGPGGHAPSTLVGLTKNPGTNPPYVLRFIPGSPRRHDDAASETFTATTREYWLGSDGEGTGVGPATVRQIWVRYRQRGAQAGQVLTVTLEADGQDPVEHTITSTTTEGVRTERISWGQAAHGFKITFEHTNDDNDETCFDIEDVRASVIVEPDADPR